MPLSGGTPRLPGDAVNQDLLPEYLCPPLRPLTQLFGYPDRACILRMNQAHDVLAPHLRESVSKRPPRALCRIPPAPRLSPQRPPDLKAGPALRVEKAEPPQQSSALPLLDRPQPVT